MLRFVLMSGVVLGLGACATQTQTAEAPKTRLTASQKLATTSGTNEAGEEIICRREKETGSRLRYTETCGTQAEWDRLDDANRDALKDFTGARAASNSS